jgi:phage gp29-like protein
MRDLTDLARETVDTDPHLAAVLAKRFGALSALPWDIIPANGPGIDPERAKIYAQVVKTQLDQLPRFGQSIYSLAWGFFDNRSALENEWMFLPSNRVGEVSVPWVVKGLGWIHPRRLRYGPERELRVLGGTGRETSSEFSVSGFDPIGTALRDMPFKFIEFTPQLFGDYPEREGLAIRCLYWSFFKRFGARERMILVELFGKPWRIIEVDEESSADDQDLREADDIVDALGATNSARMPRGTKLNVVQPQRTAGQVHAEVIKESDEQISKLVLGQVGTTDGVPAGFNSNQAAVMKDEQLMILMRDARAVSEAIEDYLTDAIIRVNFGDEAVTHAPRFKLRSDLPADRNTELDRLQKTLDAGLPVAASEAYEVAGFRIPNFEKEATVQVDQPPTPPLAPVAPPPRPVISYPTGTAPKPGEQTATSESNVKSEAEAPKLPVSDLKSVMKVNEAREREGLGKLTLPDGTLDPDGELTVVEFEAKRAAKESPATPDPSGGESPPDPDDNGPDDDDDPDDGGSSPPPSGGGSGGGNAGGDGPLPTESGAPPTSGADLGDEGLMSRGETHDISVQLADSKISDKLAAVLLGAHTDAQKDEADRVALIRSGTECGCDPVTLTTIEQPSTVFGSPESFIWKGAKEGSSETKKIGEFYADAVAGLEDPSSILSALIRARLDMNLQPLADSIHRRQHHGLMLGALDSNAEGEDDIIVKPETDLIPREELDTVQTSKIHLTDDVPFSPAFADKGYKAAVQWFLAREIFTREEFDQLDELSRQRGFTVANITADQMLRIVQAELARQIGQGADLREFKKFVATRLETAGFVPANRSHVETIYRTNVMSGYSSGRLNEMTKPETMAARPVWQILTANDGPPRQRRTHKRVHGVTLEATDPFWERAYPPFGYNCRCRVRARRRTENTKVVAGTTIRDLPDRGFSSGRRGLITSRF